VGTPGVERFYARQARDYDRRWQRYQRATHDALLTQVRGHVQRAVDVGCGTGTLLQRLLSTRVAAEGFGLDVSAAMLAQARRKLTGLNAQLLLAGAADIPLPDHSADLVTVASVLHYVLQPSQVLREIRRVLQPEGTVGIVDYALKAGTGSLRDGLIRLYDPGHVRCRGAAELLRMTERAGFTVDHGDRFPIDSLFDGVLILARAPARSTH